MVPVTLVAGVRRGTASPRLGRLPSIGAVAGALLALAVAVVVRGIVYGPFALTMAVREIVQMVRAERTPGAPA